MPANVFFADLRTSFKENLIQKLARLLDHAGLKQVLRPRDLAAVKLHFGELGNTAYIRPVFLRQIVTSLKALGVQPFLTDANTLYSGTRSDAPSHLNTAVCNGFAFSVVDAPLIIADGLRGKSETAVELGQKRIKTAYIAREIMEADSLISVAHFKCHELSGFGGAIKNVGMGCASRKGKLAQHSSVAPIVKVKKCIGCGDCIGHCSQTALSLVNEKAVIDQKRCIGCGECILICPNEAIQIKWDQTVPVFMESMVEYTLAVLQSKPDRAFFINFITDVSPACDCAPYSDAAIVRDIGILASTDVVAIDQAAADLVNQEPANPGSCLTCNLGPGEDKFKAVYPKIDWSQQLEYAQAIGLGSRDYVLEKI